MDVNLTDLICINKSSSDGTEIGAWERTLAGRDLAFYADEPREHFPKSLGLVTLPPKCC